MTGATNRWRAANLHISFDTSVWLSRRLYLQTWRTFTNRDALNVVVLFSGALDRFRCAGCIHSKQMYSRVHQSNVAQLRAVVTLMPASIHPQGACRQVAYRHCLV
jgi:hypothetical protein